MYQRTKIRALHTGGDSQLPATKICTCICRFHMEYMCNVSPHKSRALEKMDPDIRKNRQMNGLLKNFIPLPPTMSLKGVH